MFISALLMVANIALIVTIFVETGNQAGRRAKSLHRRALADHQRRQSAAFEHYEDGLEMSDRSQSFANPLFDKAARASAISALEVEGDVAVEVEVVATSAQRAAATAAAAADEV